jgi:RNA polymerase sigma-70 factor, ECF subfamily
VRQRRPNVTDAPAIFRQQLLDAIPRLRRYAKALVFDVSVADDLVQTTLERALTHWHQFDQRRDIVVWAISIAHNAYMDECRRNARMPLAEHVERDNVSASQADVAAPPGPDIGLRLDVLAALRQLPAEQRDPLLLVSLEQLSYAECAEALHIPVGTVMSRIARGRTALRALLDGRPVESTRNLRRVI